MSNEVQISLKNVNKSFGAHHVLNDVNIDINKGDFICIFGKSGGGKTTLLNILGTLETYDDGEMRSFEKQDPIKKKKECELLRRNNIAYLFQNFALVEKMTVEENMKLAVKYKKVYLRTSGLTRRLRLFCACSVRLCDEEEWRPRSAPIPTATCFCTPCATPFSAVWDWETSAGIF